MRAVLVAAVAGLLAGCASGDGVAVVSTTSPAVAPSTTTPPAPTSPPEVPSSTPPTSVAPACDPAVRRDVPYDALPGVDPALLSLDVYPAPGACAGSPAPVMVWVHGGGWSIGDKARVGPKLDLFHSLGYAVVSVNYRLSPRPPKPDDPDRVMHPDHVRDVAHALAWVSGEATGFGADAGRLVLVGHSAGAHLVSLVSTDPRHLAEAGAPDGLVDCTVALDTATFDLTRFAGGDIETPLLYTNAFGTDSAGLADASPITHVGDGRLPRFLVVTRGAAPRVADATAFAAAVSAAGGEAELLVAEGYSHADVNQRLGEPGETVVTPPVTELALACAAP
jgi:acetyl esterase/lipase